MYPRQWSDVITSYSIHYTKLYDDTSGVLLLGKNREFIEKAIKAFKNRKVKKEYVAWVEGVVYETMEIDDPILTIKKGKAFSKIDPVKGKKAYTKVTPEEVQGKKSKVKIEITTVITSYSIHYTKLYERIIQILIQRSDWMRKKVWVLIL